MGTDDTPPAAPTEHASSEHTHEPGNKSTKNNNHGGKKRDSQWAKDRQGKGKKAGGKFGGKKYVSQFSSYDPSWLILYIAPPSFFSIAEN